MPTQILQRLQTRTRFIVDRFCFPIGSKHTVLFLMEILSYKLSIHTYAYMCVPLFRYIYVYFDRLPGSHTIRVHILYLDSRSIIGMCDGANFSPKPLTGLRANTTRCWHCRCCTRVDTIRRRDLARRFFSDVRPRRTRVTIGEETTTRERKDPQK